MSENSKTTPLYDFHLTNGGKMVDFAGWMLPVNYQAGIMKEHLHCRSDAALFDVSHMGQLYLYGDDAARALEKTVPSSIATLAQGRARYSVLLNDDGGVEDDLIISQSTDQQGNKALFLVVNAARFSHDLACLQANLPNHVKIEVLQDQALLALQGPKAESALSPIIANVDRLNFMETSLFAFEGATIRVSRLGYSGEDGFELSLTAKLAPSLAQKLLENPCVALAGLGARDSLRLEAGLCLYGHELTSDTSPIAANLSWIMQKQRRIDKGFKASDKLLNEMEHGTKSRLVGILPDGRAPARQGVVVCDINQNPIGHVTSGGFSPSLNRPISMGYVGCEYAKTGTKILLDIRGKMHDATIADLPFMPHQYKR